MKSLALKRLASLAFAESDTKNLSGPTGPLSLCYNGLMRAIIVIMIMFISMMPAPSHAAPHDLYEKRVQYQINKVRNYHDLPRVRYDSCADQRAEAWALNLRRSSAFYHQNMTNVLYACDARYAGEVLARGTMKPRRTIRMWLNSPGHRAIILSERPRRIGVGVRWHPDGGRVIVVNVLQR